MIFLITVILLFIQIGKESHNSDMFYEADDDIRELNLLGCEIRSPHWVPMNYLSGNVRPLGLNVIEDKIEENAAVLIFIEDSTIDDIFDRDKLDIFPTLLITDDYVILGNKGLTNNNCKSVEPYDFPIVDNPCEILGKAFEKFNLNKIAESTCDIINF